MNEVCFIEGKMSCGSELLVKYSGIVAVTFAMLNCVVHDFRALRSCAALFSLIRDWASSSHFRGWTVA